MAAVPALWPMIKPPVVVMLAICAWVMLKVPVVLPIPIASVSLLPRRVTVPAAELIVLVSVNVEPPAITMLPPAESSGAAIVMVVV